MIFTFEPMPPYVPSPADDPPEGLSQIQQIEWRNRKEIYYHILPYDEKVQSYLAAIRQQPQDRQAGLKADMQVSAMRFIEEYISGKIPCPVKSGKSVLLTYRSSRNPKPNCERFFRETLEGLERARMERQGLANGTLGEIGQNTHETCHGCRTIQLRSAVSIASLTARLTNMRMGDEVEHVQQLPQQQQQENYPNHHHAQDKVPPRAMPRNPGQSSVQLVDMRSKKIREIGEWLIDVQIKMNEPGINMQCFKALFRHYKWDRDALAEAWLTTVEEAGGNQSKALGKMFKNLVPTTTHGAAAFASDNQFASPQSSIA